MPLDFTWPLGQAWPGCTSESLSAPPTGAGWQLWEDTTEGAPLSPVFRTPGHLADWMARDATGAFNGSTPDSAYRLIEESRKDTPRT